jgi:NhaP-type Na+/H+ or K+/H+ antiporter
MPDLSFTNLLVVAAVAVLAPMAVGFAPRLRIAAVVLEIIGGIIIGPSGFGWVRVDLPVQILALLGLAFLLFLAGLEIDVHQVRGRLLRFAVPGYLATLVLGYGAGASFAAVGWVSEPLLLAITLSATSLGLVVPVLKDAGQVHSEVGQTALAAASIADFAAIVLLSLFFSASGGSTGSSGCRTPPPRSGFAVPSCCWWRSPCWPSGSAWNPSWVPSWPAPSSAWWTATPPRTQTSAPSSTRSAMASWCRCSSSAAGSGST